MAIDAVKLVAAGTTRETNSEQIKGLEKTTKITGDYLIWNGHKIVFNTERPYIDTKDYLHPVVGASRLTTTYPELSAHLDSPQELESALMRLTSDERTMLIKLAKATKEALSKKTSFSFTDSADGKFLNGAKIIIGGNEYMAFYKGSPAQYDNSGFYYTYKQKTDFDKLKEVSIQKKYFSDNEIEYRDLRDADVAKYLPSLGSRGGRARAAQKLETIRDKAHGKELMGYIDVYTSGATTFVEHDTEGYFYKVNGRRIKLTGDQVETHPVYWDAKEEKFYYLDKKLGGLWTITRYITKDREKLIRENKKI